MEALQLERRRDTHPSLGHSKQAEDLARFVGLGEAQDGRATAHHAGNAVGEGVGDGICNGFMHRYQGTCFNIKVVLLINT